MTCWQGEGQVADIYIENVSYTEIKIIAVGIKTHTHRYNYTTNQSQSLLVCPVPLCAAVLFYFLLSVSLFLQLTYSICAASFHHTGRWSTAVSCLSGCWIRQKHAQLYPYFARQTFDSISACHVFFLSNAKVIRKKTHYPDPWSIMGEISIQIAAKSHRDCD